MLIYRLQEAVTLGEKKKIGENEQYFLVTILISANCLINVIFTDHVTVKE